MSGAAYVILGALPTSARGAQRVVVNGLDVLVSTATEHLVFHGRCGCAVAIVTETIQVPSASISIFIRAGDAATSATPGGAPGRAQELMQTIHRTPK